MKHLKNTLCYDGSFNGFLTLLYIVREHSFNPERIEKKQDQQSVLFLDAGFVPTELKKARFVWNSLRSKNYGGLKVLYFAFLSEDPHIEMKLFQYYQDLIGNVSLENNALSMTDILYLEQLATMVEKEKLTIERTLYIHSQGDDPTIKIIQPTYNILPLISKFFRIRYKEKEWVIYDAKRSYGLHHRNGNMTFTSLLPDQLQPFSSETGYQNTGLNASRTKDHRKRLSLNKRGRKPPHIQAVA